MNFRYTLSVGPGIQYDAVAEEILQLKLHDMVILQCERYEDAGQVVGCHDREEVTEAVMAREQGGDHGRRIQGNGMPAILRLATAADLARIKENAARGEAMSRTVAQQIRLHKLDMKSIGVHLVFDRSLLVVQFTAEGRVDFRELLRDLSKQLHVRVELRQIGVRDETAVHGGLGCCGRPCCCATFLHDFHSINVKLAKEQGLSLNPVNISGACGRLKCCLRYEADGYREMRQLLPRIGALVETPEGPGKVLDVNPLTQTLRVAFTPPANGAPPPPPGNFKADVVKVKPSPDACKCPNRPCKSGSGTAAETAAADEE